MTEELYVILIRGRNILTTALKTKYLARRFEDGEESRVGVITQEISSSITSISTFEERERNICIFHFSLNSSCHRAKK